MPFVPDGLGRSALGALDLALWTGAPLPRVPTGRRQAGDRDEHSGCLNPRTGGEGDEPAAEKDDPTGATGITRDDEGQFHVDLEA